MTDNGAKNYTETTGPVILLSLCNFCPVPSLTRPIVETCRLRKGSSVKYQTAQGIFYNCGSSIEALVTDEYHDVPYWTRTVVEHNGKDYYLVGYKDLSMNGLTVRIRAQ